MLLKCTLCSINIYIYVHLLLRISVKFKCLQEPSLTAGRCFAFEQMLHGGVGNTDRLHSFSCHVKKRIEQFGRQKGSRLSRMSEWLRMATSCFRALSFTAANVRCGVLCRAGLAWSCAGRVAGGCFCWDGMSLVGYSRYSASSTIPCTRLL